jgi:hypothetical protein
MLTYSFIAVCSCSLVLLSMLITDSVDDHLMQKFLSTMWFLWKARNDQRFPAKNLDDLAGTSCCSGFHRHYQFDIGTRYTAGPWPPQQHNADSDPFPPGPTGYRFGTYECSRYPHYNHTDEQVQQPNTATKQPARPEPSRYIFYQCSSSHISITSTTHLDARWNPPTRGTTTTSPSIRYE